MGDVPFSQAVDRLKKQSLSGGISYLGKKLICDLLAPYQIELKALIEGQEILLFAFLVRGKRKMPFEEVAAFFNAPTFIVIHSSFLSLVETDLDYRILRKLEKGPVFLTPKEWEEIQEDFEGEIVIQGALAEEMPFPCLSLVDRMGVFANLNFRYKDQKMRNEAEEASFEADLLETGYRKKERGSSQYYCPADQVAKSLTFLLELGWRIFDVNKASILLQKAIDLEVIDDGFDLHLKGKVRFEDYEYDLKEVVGAFNRRETFITLKDNRVGLLDYSHNLPQELTETNDGVKLKRTRLGELMDLSKRFSLDLDLFAPLQETLPSKHFQGRLYPFQQRGVDYLHYLYKNNFGGLLADEMGLGKSVQVLAFFSRLFQNGPKLIVCPTSLITNWKREVEKFLPSEEVTLFHGKERPFDLNEKSLILTTFALLRQERGLFESLEFDVVIFDEAQNFKNPESQLFKTVSSLKARCRISLTGTPVENRPLDIWSQYQVLMPGLLGKAKDFLIKQENLSTKRLLSDRMAPFFLRRTKEEVLPDLPEKIEQTIYVEMYDEQRELYEEILSNAKCAEKPLEIFEAILRLRQVCSDPRLLGENVRSAKLDLMLSDLASEIEGGRKVIIFSLFTSMLSLIKKEISIPYLYLDGKTKNRQGVVDQFQEDESIPLLLMSLKAGGVGLNLTRADTLFLFDPWWNEAIEQQAIGRSHRLGRKESVLAKRYITALSVEEKIMALKEHKKSLCSSLLDLNAEAHNLTKEDLLTLLSP